MSGGEYAGSPGALATVRDTSPRILGLWIFLMSDALIFALLLAVYATMIHATDGGPAGRDLFDIRSVLVQTGVLLLSSFTFAMVSLNLEYRPHSPRYLVSWLCLTLLLGLGFSGLELNDFSTMIGEGATAQRSGFLSAFYALVATHGLHVVSACLWLVLLLVQINRWGLDPTVTRRIQCLALFWHFLDVIWVVIYTVVYLQGLRG